VPLEPIGCDWSNQARQDLRGVPLTERPDPIGIVGFEAYPRHRRPNGFIGHEADLVTDQQGTESQAADELTRAWDGEPHEARVGALRRDGPIEVEEGEVHPAATLCLGLAHGRCRSKKAQIMSGPFGSFGNGPNSNGPSTRGRLWYGCGMPCPPP